MLTLFANEIYAIILTKTLLVKILICYLRLRTGKWKWKEQMQATDADKNTQRDHNGDLISSFRPSQSFIHIKYLKSKSEEANSVTKSANDDAESADSPLLEEFDSAQPAMQAQPPLPPNSPPPDFPLEVTIKQEVIEDSERQEIMSEYQPQSTADQNVCSSEQSSEKPKKPMCRNFVRGTCTRGSACIFSHTLDITQLKGVYTFCKNFQNRVCTLPTCKFVHATVFEKENFFRTGYLPPHTVSHLKQVLMPPPPPPPPSGTPPSSPPKAFFPNRTPANANAVQSNLPSVPVLTSQPTVNIESKMAYTMSTITAFQNAASQSLTTNTLSLATVPSDMSLKRDWSEMATFSSLQQEYDGGEPVKKTCKHCDYNEFRLSYNTAKLKVMKSSLEKCNKRMAALDKKNNKLYSCLVTLFKGGNVPKPIQATPVPSKTLLALNEEKNLFEQLGMWLSSRPTSTTVSTVIAQEDDTKDLLGGLLRTLLFSGSMQSETS